MLRQALITKNLIGGLAFWFAAIPSLSLPRIGFGIKGAPVFSSHWSPKDDTYGAEIRTHWRTCSAFGVYANIGLGGWFSLQPEVHFIHKGARHIIGIPGFLWGDIEAVYATDYLEVPVFFKTTPFSWKRLHPFITGGMYYSFLRRTEYRMTIPTLGTLTSKIETMKHTDAGFATGYGLAMDLDALELSVEYRYSMGFVDLEFPTGPGFPTVELRNMTHAVFLGIGLR
jgi:opacity protein-like surface antigen